VSLAFASLLLVVQSLGIYAQVTGHNPLGIVVLAMRGEIEPHAVDEVRGARAEWRLKVSPGQWYLRKDAAAARDNPLVDRWLIDPGHDAHVLVIAEPLDEGARFDADRLMQGILARAQQAASAFRLVEPAAPVTSSVGEARRAHTASAINGMKLESYYTVFVGKSVVYQVIAFSPAEAFAAVDKELQRIIDSFSL
jgi:hypothetical protein